MIGLLLISFMLAVTLSEPQGPEAKIVNGYESAPGGRPYIGSYQIFLDGAWQHICGCTLVTPNKVITAAHCVVAFPGIPWRVQFGSNQLYDQTSPYVQYRNVSAYQPHEGYYPGDNYPNDIATMTLERSVRITDYVQLAKLPEHRGSPYPGDTCLIVGWGKTKQFNPDYSPELREARTVALDTETCNTLFQTLLGDYFDPTLIADSNQVCLSDRSHPTVFRQSLQFRQYLQSLQFRQVLTIQTVLTGSDNSDSSMSLEAQKRKLCLALALCSVFIIAFYVLQNQRVMDMLQTGRDTDPTPVDTHKGSGLQAPGVEHLPDGGWYNFTVVSALIDIGRGNWTSFTRSYDEYLKYMHQILGLKVNLVLFVDRKAKAVAEEKRRGMEDRTRIIETTLQDIPYYKLRHRIAEIMNSTEYQNDNELVKLHLCEAFSPEYDIINWAKLYFVDRTINENPFKNNFFIWLDGGYGHGKSIYPANHVWKPRGLFDHADKVTFIELKPGVGEYVNVKDKLHKMSIAVMIGGFFAGRAVALQELYRLQRQQVGEWMEQGIADDDQTIYLTLYYKHPSLFHLVPGDWYDVFKLFNEGGS